MGQAHRSTCSGPRERRHLDAASAGKLLVLLAPVVMGALGRAQRHQALDANGLSSMLAGEHQNAQQVAPDLMSLASQLLNHDGTGSPLGALGGIVGRLFGGR